MCSVSCDERRQARFCVVVLQNSVDVVDGEIGSYSETCVMCDDNGTEEVSVKVEDAIDIKDEIPEGVPFPPVKTEEEVRVWGVCGGGSSCF
jgi:hypothetical protein